LINLTNNTLYVCVPKEKKETGRRKLYVGFVGG